MKSREANLRSKRFEADEKARKVADLQHMVREFESMAADLDRQIQSEEDRTGIKDPAHFHYSTFAQAATQRRANLKASVEDLLTKLESAIRERDAAAADLQAASAPDPRDNDRNRRDRNPGLPLR
jgi:flagellar protein FliJ